MAETQRESTPANFYPRSPCGERPLHAEEKNIIVQFLSTLSLRRATSLPTVPGVPGQHFYPRSPCGERHDHLDGILSRYNFYPRSPCGERPAPPLSCAGKCMISIHALLAESDESPALAGTCAAYFYPRSPCGERRNP